MPVIKTPFGTFQLNVEKSPVDTRDYIAEAIYGNSELPVTFSLIDQLTPVRDQGSQGTCAAQTAACMKEWQERKDVKFNEYMSPQFVYNNRENKASQGMYTRDVMKILNKIGICTEAEYPYNTFTEITDSLYESAKKYVINSYASVNTIEGLKIALYNDGPCLIAVPVYNYGLRMWKPEEPGQSILGGHAMTVVGWNYDGFIIRNSWSDNWGFNGYTTFPWEDWGLQWEVWTTIDSQTNPGGSPTKKLSWFSLFVNWLKKLFA